MPGGEPQVRRPRFKLTGLEGTEELWDRLRESGAEIESLLARNAELAAELDAMQPRIRRADELTDDELMAELPQRMTRSLAAAQEVADEMIERAKSDAMVIRLNADQTAAHLIAGAQAEVDRIVRGTIAESQAQVAVARTKGGELLRSAHAQRAEILSDLDERSSLIEREYQSLDDHRSRLEQAYEQVAAALADAKSALRTAVEPLPAAPPAQTWPSEHTEGSGRAERAGRAARRPADRERSSGTAAEAGPQVQAASPAAPAAEVGQDGRRPGVFDWSRATAGARGGANRPAATEPASGGATYAGVDAAAG